MNSYIWSKPANSKYPCITIATGAEAGAGSTGSNTATVRPFAATADAPVAVFLVAAAGTRIGCGGCTIGDPGALVEAGTAGVDVEVDVEVDAAVTAGGAPVAGVASGTPVDRVAVGNALVDDVAVVALLETASGSLSLVVHDAASVPRAMVTTTHRVRTHARAPGAPSSIDGFRVDEEELQYGWEDVHSLGSDVDRGP